MPGLRGQLRNRQIRGHTVGNPRHERRESIDLRPRAQRHSGQRSTHRLYVSNGVGMQKTVKGPRAEPAAVETARAIRICMDQSNKVGREIVDAYVGHRASTARAGNQAAGRNRGMHGKRGAQEIDSYLIQNSGVWSRKGAEELCVLGKR